MACHVTSCCPRPVVMSCHVISCNVMLLQARRRRRALLVPTLIKCACWDLLAHAAGSQPTGSACRGVSKRRGMRRSKEEARQRADGSPPPRPPHCATRGGRCQQNNNLPLPLLDHAWHHHHHHYPRRRRHHHQLGFFLHLSFRFAGFPFISAGAKRRLDEVTSG